jgi:hypothetical protein
VDKTSWFLRSKLRLVLAILGLLGMLVAWSHYPAENRFSILRCTISFLGSPDANRNPDGWRYYQVGMSALVLLLGSLAAERHIRLRAAAGRIIRVSSALIFLAIAMIFAVVWIPDTKQGEWFGMTTGKFHTRIAILAVPVMMSGIMLDGIGLLRAGVRVVSLWPFYIYGATVAFGVWQIAAWDRMCRADPVLKHWPGEGLYSTPLWEWIVFTGLMVFMSWIAKARPAGRGAECAPNGQGGA